ncbi:MAG: GNAT family N-acetyltransferase [bacterium]|nr:GNAT family N-acetyltransferase [bacterium]
MSIKDYPKKMQLKDGREVTVRPLARDDFERLLGFFKGMPAEDRVFLAHDVTDPNVIRKWTEEINFDHVVPLVALDGDQIVGDGTLHIPPRGWMQHVGNLRLVTARSHRKTGLGTLIARELVGLAGSMDLEKLKAHVIADAQGAVRMFEAVGFEQVAVVPRLVRDQKGAERDLAIMINDVASLTRVLEDWIQDSMIPAFRSPGEG